MLVVVWRITEICNLSCGFCAYSRAVHRSRASANVDEVRVFGSVLSEYARAAGRDVLVSWLGGEPMLWPPLWEISQAFAHAGGLRVSATTNGTALRSESVRQHLVDDFSELTLSVDGVGRRHDELRGAPGLFDEMRANVLALRELRQRCGRGPRLRVNTVLLRDNIFELESLCRELAAWGVEELTFNALGGRDRPEFFPAHRLLPEHIAWLRRELPGLRECSAALGLTILGGDRYLQRLEASALVHPWPIADCAPGQRFLFIDEQGRVAPCSFTGDDYGVHLRDLRTADDVRRLPAHFAALRVAHRALVCADCPSTNVFGKFG